jgi:spore coat protein U-like protein
VSKKNHIIISVLIIFFLLFKPGIVWSQCTVGATPITFGNYDIFSIYPVDTTGTITVNCISDVVRAMLTAGVSQTSGVFNPRQMKRLGGTDLLNYNIFTDASRTSIFGSGTGGTTGIELRRPPGKPAPWSQMINIYGRIPTGQDISVGSYSDTLTFTITW